MSWGGDIDAEQFAEVDLSNTEISGTIPREISMLSDLQELDLSDTHISGTIPREISMLEHL